MHEREFGVSEERASERDDRAVYIISVAAELAGVHPQTLRIYERKGLVRPKRTSGNVRRYSNRDIEHLQKIQDLTQAQGINLAGVKLIMQLRDEIEALHERAERLELELRSARRFQRRARRSDGTISREIVPLRSVFLPQWDRTPER
jgi:MerR family transcriptional regulator/heat shock protein HspR